MTGYHISIGYLSGADPEDAWLALKGVVASICAQPLLICKEAMQLGMDHKVAYEYSQPYATFSAETGRTEDSTLVIQGYQKYSRGESQVMQLAGGYGASRDIKEAMRRAVCRLVMAEMHKREFEVNININVA